MVPLSHIAEINLGGSPFRKVGTPLTLAFCFGAVKIRAKTGVSCEIDLVQIRVNLDLANLCENGFCVI